MLPSPGSTANSREYKIAAVALRRPSRFCHRQAPVLGWITASTATLTRESAARKRPTSMSDAWPVLPCSVPYAPLPLLIFFGPFYVLFCKKMTDEWYQPTDGPADRPNSTVLHDGRGGKQTELACRLRPARKAVFGAQHTAHAAVNSYKVKRGRKGCLCIVSGTAEEPRRAGTSGAVRSSWA